MSARSPGIRCSRFAQKRNERAKPGGNKAARIAFDKDGPAATTRSSDRNLVNFGNSGNADGANANRWNPDNQNPGIGCAFSEALRDALGLRPARRLFFKLSPTAYHFTHNHNPFF